MTKFKPFFLKTVLRINLNHQGKGAILLTLPCIILCIGSGLDTHLCSPQVET